MSLGVLNVVDICIDLMVFLLLYIYVVISFTAHLLIKLQAAGVDLVLGGDFREQLNRFKAILVQWSNKIIFSRRLLLKLRPLISDSIPPFVFFHFKIDHILNWPSRYQTLHILTVYFLQM